MRQRKRECGRWLLIKKSLIFQRKSANAFQNTHAEKTPAVFGPSVVQFSWLAFWENIPAYASYLLTDFSAMADFRPGGISPLWGILTLTVPVAPGFKPVSF